MTRIRILFVGLAPLIVASAFSQQLILPSSDSSKAVSPKDRQVEIEAFERRLTQASTGSLLGRIARDRKQRPEVYAFLIHTYQETAVGDPRSRGGLAAPDLLTEVLSPSMTLPWLYLYLRPVPFGVVPKAAARVRTAVRMIGGSDAVEAVRLQLEATLQPGHYATKQSSGVRTTEFPDPADVVVARAQLKFLEDAVALSDFGGLEVLLDMVPRIHAARATRPSSIRLEDPFAVILRNVSVSESTRSKLLKASDRLVADGKSPERRAVLQRLRKALSGDRSIP